MQISDRRRSQGTGRHLLSVMAAALASLPGALAHAEGAAGLPDKAVTEQSAIIERLVVPPEKGRLTIVIEPPAGDGPSETPSEAPCDRDPSGCGAPTTGPKAVKPAD